MNEPLDNVAVTGMLVTVAIIIMAMFVALAYRMPLKHARWFITAAFAVMAALLFREHWAAGTLVVILGGGGIAGLSGILRQVEQDKIAREAKTEV